MANTLLLFDIDGTLLRTHGAGMRAMDVVARRLFGPGFHWEGIQVSGHLDPLIFAEAAAINGLDDVDTHHEAFRDQYILQLQEELQANRDRVRAERGVHAILDTLRQRADQQGDVVLGLLTGNYRQAGPIKLKAVGIDPGWFEVTAFGDEAPSRADLVPVAMQRYETLKGQPIAPHRVVVIGDTPRDVACAAAHGCVSFGVATGRFRVDDLHQAGAHTAVENLDDPTPLFALIDALT